jgi:hypothetical protein
MARGAASYRTFSKEERLAVRKPTHRRKIFGLRCPALSGCTPGRLCVICRSSRTDRAEGPSDQRVVAGGNGMARRLPGGALCQIEPSLGHRQQMGAVGEASGGVRELETKQGELPILILLDHRVHFPNSETRLPGLNQELATRSPKLGQALQRNPGTSNILGASRFAGCRPPMTKFRQFVFSQGAGTNAKYLSSQVERLFEDHDERNSRPLVARRGSVLVAGEAREGAAFFMPVPAAQVMGVMWMASMYLDRPGRGRRKRRRHRAGEGKQAQAYSRCQNCRAHDDLPIGAI